MPTRCSGWPVAGLVVVNRLGPLPKSKSTPLGMVIVHTSLLSAWSAQATVPSPSLSARIVSV
jgi:hypothetical protein